MPPRVVRPDDLVFGSVGQPLPGTQVKIAEDGEVLLRGPHVMRGYRNLPEVNAETLLPDGWLATGDIGELDDQGRLWNTDRKKDLVKTSGGKYIAPGEIAAEFKVDPHRCPSWWSRKRLKRRHRIDLPGPEALQKSAAENGPSGDLTQLAESSEVREALQADVDASNDELIRGRRQEARDLPRDLSEEEGELTVSLKVSGRW